MKHEAQQIDLPTKLFKMNHLEEVTQWWGRSSL
jgi:hypothetical protein